MKLFPKLTQTEELATPVTLQTRSREAAGSTLRPDIDHPQMRYVVANASIVL